MVISSALTLAILVVGAVAYGQGGLVQRTPPAPPQVRDEKVREDMWSRLDAEPVLVRAENKRLGADNTDSSQAIIELAAALRLGDHEDAARLIENAKIWSEDIVWTPEWARRLQGEIDRLEKDFASGKVDASVEPLVKRALHHFAIAPKLARFRETYQKMLVK